MSPDRIARFEEAHKIATTGIDSEGQKYSSEGRLNQAAWAGENCIVLIQEIRRLKSANAELLEALKAVVASASPHPTEQPTMHAAWKKAHAAIKAGEVAP